MLEETSLLFVKPDAFDVSEDIFRYIDRLSQSWGHRAKTVPVLKAPQYLVEQHYEEHLGKSFYAPLIESIAGNNITLAVYRGRQGLVERLMDITGRNSDPSKCAMGTVRFIWGMDNAEAAKAQNRSINNVIHRSDSALKGKIEEGIWQPKLQLSF